MSSKKILNQDTQYIRFNASLENLALKIFSPPILTFDSSTYNIPISDPANNVNNSTNFLFSRDHSKNSLLCSSFLIIINASITLVVNGNIKNTMLEDISYCK